ncbi:unnamed protein product [Ambrosiozyma monospora]|uniref:Unnamed protein product n=1 Tax=Ambrosiozyma monospora TaxID=43982 RepID=A0ACB5T2G7_AMBMO|nr:unnamed protein product [Ambrosiozyma monospora]
MAESTNTDTWGPNTKQKKQLLDWILAYTGAPESTGFYDGDQTSYGSDSKNGFGYDGQAYDRYGYGGSDAVIVNQSTYTSEVGRYSVGFIVDRLEQYCNARPKSIYDSLKKNLVTKGYEFLIVTKCLTLLEFLLLNCFIAKKGSTTIAVMEYDILPDCKELCRSILNRLQSYQVKVAYDNLNLHHEKAIHETSKKLLEWINDKDVLLQERAKFHPELADNQSGNNKHKKTVSGNVFYEGEVLNHDSIKLSKDKQPFDRSRVSNISSQLGNMILSPSKNRHRSSSSVSLSTEENDLIKFTKGHHVSSSLNAAFDPYADDEPQLSSYNDNQNTHSRSKSYSYSDSLTVSSNKFKSGANRSPQLAKIKSTISEEENDDDFGDFQTTDGTSTTKKSTTKKGDSVIGIQTSGASGASDLLGLDLLSFNSATNTTTASSPVNSPTVSKSARLSLNSGTKTQSMRKSTMNPARSHSVDLLGLDLFGSSSSVTTTTTPKKTHDTLGSISASPISTMKPISPSQHKSTFSASSILTPMSAKNSTTGSTSPTSTFNTPTSPSVNYSAFSAIPSSSTSANASASASFNSVPKSAPPTKTSFDWGPSSADVWASSPLSGLSNNGKPVAVVVPEDSQKQEKNLALFDDLWSGAKNGAL